MPRARSGSRGRSGSSSPERSRSTTAAGCSSPTGSCTGSCASTCAPASAGSSSPACATSSGSPYDDQLRLYVAAGDRIYRLAGGRKTVIAGNGQRGHTGDGGPATAASFGGIGGFEVDHDKSIVVAEYDNWIRFVDPNGSVSTIAGNGEEGYAGDGGPARVAVLRHPHDLALRIDREVIVADSHNGVLRRIDPSGTITTFATGFLAPIAVKGGAGNSLYVADGGQNAVFRLSADGQSRRRVVRANGPINLAVDDKDNVYVSEIAGARRVLRVVAGGPGPRAGPLDQQAGHVHDAMPAM